MNPLRRVAQFFSWLRRVSVWGPDAIPAREKDYQLLTRLVFPFVDLLIVAMGVLGAAFRVPALDERFDAGRVNNLDLHAKRFSIYRQDWDLKKELKDLGD